MATTDVRPDQKTAFYEKTTLDNGLRVVTSRMNHVHSATITFLFGVGARYELDSQAGISHFIEHMAFKGTEKRPDPAMITTEIEEVGGIINAATGRESTNFWVKVPAAHVERAFDVLSDILLHSTLREHELERERHVIIEEIRGVHDTPDDLVHDLIDEVVWDRQPVGRSILGYESTIGAVTSDDMRAFIDRHYRPERLVIAAAGRIDHQQIVELAEQWFGEMATGIGDQCQLTDKEQRGPKVHLVNRGTEQAHLCIGHPAIPFTDERRYTQAMIDSVLSSGMSSRLFQEIRERRGLVYAVYGYFRQSMDVGQGVIYAGTDLDRVDETISAIVGELARLRAERISDEELHRNKELSKGRIVIGLEDSRAVAGWIGGQELTHEEIKTPREVMELIDAVDAGDMLELAREIYQDDSLHLALIGPYDNEDRFRDLLTF
ncbi:MAG: M16 family metallopeptidase [Chloroflexota bacterium]